MKGGIPYFPLDCQLDEKFELIEAEFGLTGFSVVVKILQRIYGGQGYYCEWSNEVALLFAKKLGLGGSVVSEIVSVSIKRGVFSKALYEEYSILTSLGIQKRYLDAVSRRKIVQVEKCYLLVQCDQISKNVDIISGNVYRNQKNVYISEQRREEKSIYYGDVDDARPREEFVGDVENLTTSQYLFSNYFTGAPSKSELQTCDSWLQKYDHELVEHAFFNACKSGNKNIGYVRGVLRNFDARGIKDMGDVAEDDMRRKK